MPNVLLTQRCVRSCPYCFAGKRMGESPPDRVLSWEDLVYLADLFQAAGEKRFALLGGEPAIHPHFNEMVVYLLERGFAVHVFTSGAWPEKVLEEAWELFGRLPPGPLTFLCNLNDPLLTPAPEPERRRVDGFLRHFGDRSAPGFNSYHKDFTLDFLFRAIDEHGMNRTIRLGAAHPIVGQGNAFITPADMQGVVDRIFTYTPLFERLRVLPGFDCGFPLCRFREEHLAWLYRNSPLRNDFGCNPVVDIGPDLSVWPCFPLSSFRRRSILEFDSLADVFRHHKEIFHKIRVEAGGIYPECDGCSLRERELCMGGCVAHNLRTFQDEERLRVAEMYL